MLLRQTLLRGSACICSPSSVRALFSRPLQQQGLQRQARAMAASSSPHPTGAQLSEHELDSIVQDAVVWASQNGLVGGCAHYPVQAGTPSACRVLCSHACT